MNLCLKFRPSSHSDTATVVATFENSKVAKRAAALGAKCSGKQAFSQVYHAVEGTIDSLEDRFKQMGATAVAAYACYQELTITVQLPSGTSDETLPLIADWRVVELVRRLRSLHVPRRTRIRDDVQKTYFRYSGGMIFENGRFRFADGTTLPQPENVKVKIRRPTR